MKQYINYSNSSSSSLLSKDLVSIKILLIVVDHNWNFNNSKVLALKNFVKKSDKIFREAVIFGNICQIWQHLATLVLSLLYCELYIGNVIKAICDVTMTFFLIA